MARSFSGSLSSDDLQKHVMQSYFIMRVGVAVIGIAFPLLLLLGGEAIGICAQNSMSAYYHAVSIDGWSMRNWFVGLLFAVSISLGLYRGFSRTEDYLLDGAGLFGVGIALFHMSWKPADSPCPMLNSGTHEGAAIFGLSLHFVCAIAFFICIAFVCWFCADDTLPLEPNPSRRKILKRVYRSIAVAMPVLMILAAILNRARGMATFWVETAGILAFGVYWFVKGLELKRTAADQKAAAGVLRLRSGVVEEIQALGEPDIEVDPAAR